MIWPFKGKMKTGAKLGAASAQELMDASFTLIRTAIAFNAPRLRQDMEGVSGPGIEGRETWVVEARRADEKDFLIWSIEHGSWWMPDHSGYTDNVMNAGRYTFDEAIDIVNNPHTVKPGIPNEAIVLAETYQV